MIDKAQELWSHCFQKFGPQGTLENGSVHRELGIHKA